MPVLKKPSSYIPLVLPPRKGQLAAHTNVVVIGGGPAGIGASMGAAKAGAGVILAERYGFLGGNATAALVMPMMSYHTERTPADFSENREVLLPADHGPGDPVIAGVLLEFLRRLINEGGVIAPSFNTGYVVPFDPEIFKITAIEMLDDNNVNMLFHSFASGIFLEKNTKGVILETKSGPLVITADVIVDCTGDGDIAAAAGADFSIGRDPDGLAQPMSLLFRITGFNRKNFFEYIRKHPDQWHGVHGLWDLIRQAAEAGELNLPREDVLFFDTMHDEEVSVNSTRIIKVLGTDVWDISFAEAAGRRQVKQIAAFLKKYVPGFSESYVMQTGTTVGVRESRRIRGDYIITAHDIGEARKFDDVIAKSTYPVDIHNPEGKGTILKKLPPGESYDIPLRCLLPKNVEDLLVAGRCISGDHVAHSSYRVMPVSMATGHAAGVCAALAAINKVTPRNVDALDVQKELIKQGAYL